MCKEREVMEMNQLWAITEHSTGRQARDEQKHAIRKRVSCNTRLEVKKIEPWYWGYWGTLCQDILEGLRSDFYVIPKPLWSKLRSKKNVLVRLVLIPLTLHCFVVVLPAKTR